jgi:hypothetical protein
MGLPLSIDDVRQRYGRSAPLDTGNDVLQKTTTNAASSLADSSRENAANDEDEPAVGGATMRLHRALLPAAGESVSACELRVAGLLAAKGGADADTTAPAEVFALDADLERRMRDACADAPSVAAMEGRLRDLLQGVERDHTGRVAYLLYHTSALGFLAGRYQVMRDAADLRALRSFAGRAMRTFSTVIDDWSDLPMQEAVDWFKRKGVIDADLWQQIEPDLRKRSFYAAKLGTVNQMQTAHSAILRGLETGASRESVVKEMAGQFGKQVNRAYLRFLFDQNVATAQSHARWMRQKETIFDRPFGRLPDDGRRRRARRAPRTARHRAAAGRRLVGEQLPAQRLRLPLLRGHLRSGHARSARLYRCRQRPALQRAGPVQHQSRPDG